MKHTQKWRWMRRLFAVTTFALAATAVIAVAWTPASRAATLRPINRVVLIVEENSGRSAALAQMPYLASLADTYATVPGYKNLTHPSLPNYMALTSGHDLFNGMDCAPTKHCQTGADNIFHQLGSRWSVWAESMPGNCYHGHAPPYAARHTAAPYYTDIAATCKTRDVPLDASAPPGMRKAGRFILAIPDMNNDAHDGPLSQADSWLHGFLGILLQRSAYTNGSTVIEVTFDEGSHHLLTVLINPRFTHVSTSGSFDHYALLQFNESMLGLPYLGNAATANDLRTALGL